MHYDICEIFYSLQGEGLLQGMPMVFIRLSGCNLRCNFCDTKYAWKDGSKKTVEHILAEADKYPCKTVCITGGEPFLQDLSPLVGALKQKKYRVAAETNGTAWQPISFDWLAVSPKAGGVKFHPCGYDKRFLQTASEFKYVIKDKKDIGFINTGITRPLVLQPADNSGSAVKEIGLFLKTNPGANRYLRMQMHKIAGIK